MKFNFFHYLLPRLEVHIWGGLGSQLYGVAKYYELSEKFPLRKFTLVFHNGGVTRREPESLQLVPSTVKIKCVNDFVANIKPSGENKNKDSVKVPYKVLTVISKILKSLLLKTMILVEANSSDILPRFWTLQIRGHYRNQNLSMSIVSRIYVQALSQGLISDSSERNIVIHYRLDDLIGLKPIVDSKKIEKIVLQISQEHLINNILLFSDSYDLAERKLSKLRLNANKTDNSIWVVIDAGINSTFFIGTNSKISYWIILFRLFLDKPTSNYLPDNLRSEFTTDFAKRKILFYENSQSNE